MKHCNSVASCRVYHRLEPSPQRHFIQKQLVQHEALGHANTFARTARAIGAVVGQRERDRFGGSRTWQGGAERRRCRRSQFDIILLNDEITINAAEV